MLGSDAGDRTLPPTQRRRRKARLAGDVVRSAELTAAITLFAASSAFWWLASGLAEAMTSTLRRGLTTVPVTSLTISSFTVLTQDTGSMLGKSLVSLAMIVLICAVAGNVVQTGWILNVRSILPKFGWRTPLRSGRLAESAGLILRSILLFVVTWFFVVRHQSQLIHVGQSEIAIIVIRSARLIGELMLQLSTSLFGYGLLDYGCRFWAREQRLKMTVEERRREQQEDEVNSAIEQRRETSRRASGTSSSRVEPMGPLNG